MQVEVFVGTEKGAFVFRSDRTRNHWQIDGPLFKGWKVTAAHRTADGTYLAATSSWVYGPAIHRSRDLREWQQVVAGPAYPEASGRKLNQIWTMTSGHGACYAGVDEAGLFRSRDDGETWQPVEGLNEHPTRSAWPPGAGGLCAHAVLLDPADPDRLWCGISAAGMFRSEDGGASWRPANRGVRVVAEDKVHKDIGFCVHGLAQHPDDADRIYRQDHAGMYRSVDGGDTWTTNEEGLPSSFGFPIALDRQRRQLFAVPLESDQYRVPSDGALRVYRSRDDGDSWQAAGDRGLPSEHAYTGVLRGALAVDHLAPCGVYFGTTGGQVFFSADDGDSWTLQPCALSRILCVEAFTPTATR